MRRAILSVHPSLIGIILTGMTDRNGTPRYFRVIKNPLPPDHKIVDVLPCEDGTLDVVLSSPSFAQVPDRTPPEELPRLPSPEMKLTVFGDSQIQPLAGKVLILIDDAPEHSDGGIVIPEMAKERPRRGMVLAVGEGVEHVDVGHVVLYERYKGMQLRHEGEDLVILGQDDVIGIVNYTIE